MDNNLITDISSVRHGVFIEGVLEGKELHEAAKIAGFTTPERDAYPILAEPRVRQFIRRKLRGRAETEGGAVAINFLIRMVRDEGADKALRVNCAKFLYEHAVPAHKAQEAPNDEKKEVSDMTPEELREFIAAGEAELAARATPIDITPKALDDML